METMNDVSLFLLVEENWYTDRPLPPDIRVPN